MGLILRPTLSDKYPLREDTSTNTLTEHAYPHQTRGIRVTNVGENSSNTYTRCDLINARCAHKLLEAANKRPLTTTKSSG